MENAAQAISELKIARDTPSIVFAQPQLFNEPDPYWSQIPQLSPATTPFTFETRGARLLHPGSWVVVAPDTFVTDTAFWGHQDFDSARRWHAIFRRKRVFPSKRLDGRVLSLASDFAPWSYGHWLIDSLPRYSIAKSTNLDLNSFDYIYLPSPATPSTQHLLAGLRIDPSRLLTTPPTCDLEIDNLTAVSFPGSPGSACSLARQMAAQLNPPRAPRRRLFLSRVGHRRNFVDADAIWTVLRRHDFEFCDPATSPDALSKCSEASVVFGIEGSQMFNALFAPSGGKMIVVGPDNFHPLPYMQSIAGAAGLSLSIIGARTQGSDFGCILAPERLDACLRQILS